MGGGGGVKIGGGSLGDTQMAVANGVIACKCLFFASQITKLKQHGILIRS